MREPTDYQQSVPTLRTFTLNSAYAHWLTLADQEESMLPRVAQPESLNGRVERMPPGVEGEDGSGLGHAIPRQPAGEADPFVTPDLIRGPLARLNLAAIQPCRRGPVR